jgi:hypothetical protein
MPRPSPRHVPELQLDVLLQSVRLVPDSLLRWFRVKSKAGGPSVVSVRTPDMAPGEALLALRLRAPKAQGGARIPQDVAWLYLSDDGGYLLGMSAEETLQEFAASAPVAHLRLALAQARAREHRRDRADRLVQQDLPVAAGILVLLIGVGLCATRTS